MQALTKIHAAAPFYISADDYTPFVQDDQGNAVQSDYNALALFLNDQYTSIPAALEVYGMEWNPPNLM